MGFLLEERGEKMKNQEKWLRLIKSATFGKDVYFLRGKKITLGRIFELPDCLEAIELTAKDEVAILVLWGRNLGLDEAKKEEEKK